MSAAPGSLGKAPTKISGGFRDTSAENIENVARGEEPRGEEDLGEGKFTVKQVKRESTKKRTGLDAMVHAYAKYNVSITPELKVAMKKAGEMRKSMFRHMLSVIHETNTSVLGGNMWGTVSATPPSGYDYEYLSPVKVGTPAQTINMDFDTGSADL